MKYKLLHYNQQLKGNVPLNASKSESNRALLIQALGEGIDLSNLATARDTVTMKRLLSGNTEIWDVLDAGTTMRFCTAYLGLRGTGQTITGSERMKQRPIELLAEALNALGAKIEYLGNIGYPPLRIIGLTEQKQDKISIPGNISSQYISALLMIAPALPRGLVLTLTGEIYSRPYIEMTLTLMKHFGVDHQWNENRISIPPQTYKANTYEIEGDWSGASYWYGAVALSQGSSLTLETLKRNSLQGDQAIAKIMEDLGVETTFDENGAHLRNVPVREKKLLLDFRKCPDLAQTVMVVATLKGVELEMEGLESLRIKETDRIAAMQNELAKIGGSLEEGKGKWYLKSSGGIGEEMPEIETYEDHRMAMAFAPVCMDRNVIIRDPAVVEKSYPSFWDHYKTLGIHLEEI